MKLPMRFFSYSLVVLISLFFSFSSFADGFSFSFGNDSLPSGGYLNSCNSCSMMNNNLSCFCRDEQGFWDAASMYVPHRCNDVENANGQLVCEHYWHHHHHHRHWHHHHFRHCHWHHGRWHCHHH